MELFIPYFIKDKDKSMNSLDGIANKLGRKMTNQR